MLDEYLNLYESIGEEVNQLALDVLIERVRRHELDAGFIPLNQATKPLIQDLNFTKVAESKLNLIVSPGNPLLEKGTLTHRSRPAAPTLRPV